MIKKIIEALGYDWKQFKEQIYSNEVDYTICGHMWDVKDDVIIDILYNEFFDDVDGACEIINMLEDKFGYSEYLHYAIIFRDRNLYK